MQCENDNEDNERSHEIVQQDIDPFQKSEFQRMLRAYRSRTCLISSCQRTLSEPTREGFGNSAVTFIRRVAKRFHYNS